jgi:hypothetical protein
MNARWSAAVVPVVDRSARQAIAVTTLTGRVGSHVARLRIQPVCVLARCYETRIVSAPNCVTTLGEIAKASSTGPERHEPGE